MKIKQSKNYNKVVSLLRDSFVYSFLKKARSQLANFLNDNPSKYLFVIGVTWTNGKTTTVNILHHILNMIVSKTFLLSTSKVKIWDKSYKKHKRSHMFNVFEVNWLLARARDQWCRIAVLECSTFALGKWNFDGIDFDGAILTNLTHDHDDYTRDFDDHAKQKKQLFRSILRNDKQNKFAVFSKDDKIWRKWFDQMPFDKKINFSINSSSILKAEDIQESLEWTIFVLSYLGKKHTVHTQLLGAVNVSNILAALGMVIEMGVDLNKAIETLKNFVPLEHRLEHITQNNIHYFLDISHSPDALDKTLQYLSHVKKWKLIVVFGVTWNKGKQHRAKIGKIVERYADIMVATDQEPWTENRLDILHDLTEQIKKKEWENFFVIPERRFAFKFSVEIAQADDIVLYACKHRGYIQRTNIGKRVWNDKEVLLKELKKNLS